MYPIISSIIKLSMKLSTKIELFHANNPDSQIPITSKLKPTRTLKKKKIKGKKNENLNK